MQKFIFSVDSALLGELGELLVESVHVALVELVKNAYDADATKVTIRFRLNSKGMPEIHIIDNGTGMSLADIENFWMRIATTNKVKKNRSPLYGRPRTGSKGIGRFACRRLGNHLRLISVAKLSPEKFEKTELEFQWLNFEPGTDVTKIECPGKTESLFTGQTGTELIITGGFENEWKNRGWAYVKRQLAVLVANRGMRRSGFKEDPGFNIYLDAPSIENERVIDLRDELIAAGWGTLIATISDQGKAVCELDAVMIGKKKIIGERTYKHLKGVSFRIGIIANVKEQFRNSRLLSKYNVSQILDEWGGVQVRYNGVRVYPYGEDDWLGIDKDRGVRKGSPHAGLIAFAKGLEGIDPSRSLLNLLSMKSHVGEVEINDQESNFQIKMNREGFLENDSWLELKDFVRYGIDWASICRDYYIRQQARESSEEARKEFEKTIERKVEPEQVVQQVVSYINDEFKNLSAYLPAKEKSKISKVVSKATSAILSHEKSIQQELHHFRLIASTSTLLLIFSHEIKAFLEVLDDSSMELASFENELNKQHGCKIKDVRNQLIEAKTRFRELIEMTSLIGVDSRKSKVARIVLRERVAKAIQCFKLILSNYEIEIDYNDVAANIMVGPILEAELYSILLNVLSNSIKSVIAGRGTKTIKISAARIKNKTVIQVRDTGIGLDEKYYEEVFLPFKSDIDKRLYDGLKQHLNPADHYIVGTGSGLGLSVAKEILQVRNGEIRFQTPSRPWKAILEIIMP